MLKITLDTLLDAFRSLNPVLQFVVAVGSALGITGLAVAIKMYVDARTIRKISLETRKLEHEERVRESPIQPSTLEDVRRYDPRIRAVDRTVEAEDQAKRERLKRWYDGLQGIAALLAALKEMLDSIRNARRRGTPPDDKT